MERIKAAIQHSIDLIIVLTFYTLSQAINNSAHLFRLDLYDQRSYDDVVDELLNRLAAFVLFVLDYGSYLYCMVGGHDYICDYSLSPTGAALICAKCGTTKLN